VTSLRLGAWRRRLLVPLALVVAAVAGCGPDPFAPIANNAVVPTAFNLWAVTGSPAPFPTAFVVASNAPVRLEPSGAFDFAVDITPAGKLQVLPMSKVITPIGGARALALQVAADSYPAVTEAPRTGWAQDTILELDVGQTFLVRVVSQLCQFQGQPVVHAKFRVDSINIAERRAFFIGRINPNCGFRSFADGIPEF
jgi:hypothetical protein